MSIFFDSPIAYCPVAKRYVLLDQTQKCCAEDMGCIALNCPLAKHFAPTSMPKETATHDADGEPPLHDEPTNKP